MMQRKTSGDTEMMFTASTIIPEFCANKKMLGLFISYICMCDMIYRRCVDFCTIDV